MSVKWTDKQLEAITAKGSNILVAAAAGSGKTAVLVERIIRIITNEENPVSVDRLLVLTYTEAAASEMKRKIADAIDKKLEENPGDKWLREQAVKVDSASISTIHAFCSRIINNNAHLTNLPADFSLIDETENKVLQAQAVDHVMESYYSRLDKKAGFRELVTGWSSIKGDDNLRKMVIKLHNISRSLAYPRRWFADIYKGGYKSIKDTGSIKASSWMGHLKNTLSNQLSDINSALNRILSIIQEEVPVDHPMYKYYFEMCSSFKAEYERADINTDEGFRAVCDLIKYFEIKRAASKKGIEDIEPRLSFLRDEFVKKKLKEATYIISIFDDDNINMISKCEPAVKALCNIVRLTEKVHQKYKRERSVIDFNDLEYGLFSLVINEKGEDTPLCQKLRDFYHEILIDEFQDTNRLQFEIFSRLSKKCGNLFMVGDVKQSIYKFRNADPSIFIDLYKKYKTGDGGQLICLSQNFRSRQGVIDCVNDVFDAVMSERCGEVDYTADERLVCGASYPQNDNCETELMITDLVDTDVSDALMEELKTENLESRAVAERIKRIVCDEKFKVYDKDTDAMRDVRFGDIAVICRNKQERNTVESELIALGINSVTEGGQHYLTSIEVSTVIAFLQIIDNPIQDIPLIAVMRSAIFSFSAEELAVIRKCAGGRFYNAVVAAANEGNERAAEFVDYLSELRACAKYMGVDELARKICSDKKYFAIVGAMPSGELRKANLKLLLERCADYEKGTLTGLFNFIKYIEMLKSTDADFAPAKENTDESEAVKIMTIHKSKGLEFPVVILFRMGKNFNREDFKDNIICYDKVGLGLDYVDTRQRIRFPMPTREIVKAGMEASSVAEEMRLFYVAMTRAKEKLIISASVTSRMNNWKKAEFDSNGRLMPCVSLIMNNMRDWIFSALIKHPSAKIIRDMAGRCDIIPSLSLGEDIKVYKVDLKNDVWKCETEVESSKPEYDNKDILARLEYVYPYAHLSKLPIKMSVSEAKRRQMSEDGVAVGNLMSPKGLISDLDNMDAAEKGTITHFVIQHMDIYKTDELDDVKMQIDNMLERAQISQKQRESVDDMSVYRFFSSELGARLKSAERYEREYDFYLLVRPDEIDSSISVEGADDIILQGIADCFFYDGDGIVLIDFKTDGVTAEQAEKRADNYRLQMEYYSKGLSAAIGITVKERYLYFLSCGEVIKV